MTTIDTCVAPGGTADLDGRTLFPRQQISRRESGAHSQRQGGNNQPISQSSNQEFNSYTSAVVSMRLCVCMIVCACVFFRVCVCIFVWVCVCVWTHFYLKWTLAVVVLDLLVSSADQQHSCAVILDVGRTGRGVVSQNSAGGVRASEGRAKGIRAWRRWQERRCHQEELRSTNTWYLRQEEEVASLSAERTDARTYYSAQRNGESEGGAERTEGGRERERKSKREGERERGC